MVTRELDSVMDSAAAYLETLQQLCTVLSKRFPDDTTFWQTLANEQTQHLQWLQEAKRFFASNNGGLDLSRIHVKAIESGPPYMAVVKTNIEQKAWPYVTIIDEIRDFEQNLLDCGLITVLQIAGSNKHPQIEQLSLGVQKHCKQLQNKLSEVQMRNAS